MEVLSVIGYDESVEALGDSDEVHAARVALLLHVQVYPDRGEPMEGLNSLVAKTRSQPGMAALRLVYRVEGETILLYDLSRYDELAEGHTLRSS
jgi:hypothetical protein